MWKRAWKKIAGVLLTPSGLGGACLGLTVFQLNPGGQRLAGIVVGWLYGISVWGLARLLPVGPGWAWLSGLIVGPIPLALLMPADTPAVERGVILLGALVGCLLGLLEVAHARRATRPPVPPARLESSEPLEL